MGAAQPVRGRKDSRSSLLTRHPANNGANYKAGDHTHGPESYTQKGLGNVRPDCVAYVLQPEEQAYLGIYGQNLLTDNRVQEPSNQPSSSRRHQSTFDYLGTSKDDSDETYEKRKAEFLRLKQLSIDKARAAFEAAELRKKEEEDLDTNTNTNTNNAQHTQANKKDKTMPEPDSTTVPDLRPDVLKYWAKQSPRIPVNKKDWKLLTRGQLDNISSLAYCAELRKKLEKVQEQLEEQIEKEKERRKKGEDREWRRQVCYRLPDGRLGFMTKSKLWAFCANKLRALDEREEELKKLRQEKEKEGKEDLDTNTNTNNAQHTQANKKDEMVPEPDSAMVLDSRPKGRIPPIIAARLRVLEERTKRLDEWKKEECRTLDRWDTLYYEISCVIGTAIFSAIWPDFAGFWPELYAHIIGCSSCEASSDLDASVSNDTHCLRHGQAIHENGETPEPDSTTVLYPAYLWFSSEQRRALFDLLDKLEKRLKEEKEMKDWLLKEFKNVDPYEEEEEEEEDEEEEDEEEEDEEEEDEEEEDEEEEEGDTDGSSSYGSSSDFDESSDSDTDSLGHGQAIRESSETPKPNSTTVPDPGRFQVTRKQRLFFRALNELETRLKQEKELKKLKKAEMEEEKEEEEDEEDEEEDEDEDEEDEDWEDTDGSSSYGSSSDFDSPGHGQAITPKPEHECCTTGPDTNVVGTSMAFPDKFIFAKTPPAWILNWLRALNKMLKLLTEFEKGVKAFELKKEEGEVVEEGEEIRKDNRVRLLNECGKKFKEGLDEVWEYMEKEGFMGRFVSWDEYMLMKEEEEEEDGEEDGEDEEEQEEDGEEDDEEDKEEGDEEEGEDPDGSSSCGASSDLHDMEASSSDKDSPGHGQAITLKPDSATVPDPRTAEQEYRITLFSTTLTFPDINAARAHIEEVQKELDGWKKELEEERGRYLFDSYSYGASSDLNDMEISSSDKVSPGPGQAIQEPRETHEPELDAVMALASDATEPTSRDSVTLTNTTKDDTTEVITITELPADSGNLDSSNETSAGLEEDWRNHPELVETDAEQEGNWRNYPELVETNPWQEGNWRNYPELVETNPWQEEDLTPRIAYHHKMPGWTYHHPSPAWSFEHYPQTGWTYYHPMPSWSYYYPGADKILYYFPSPHLSVHHPTQTWYYCDDAAMGWIYCDHAQVWEFLHPAPCWLHPCPKCTLASPDWIYYRSFTGPTATII